MRKMKSLALTGLRGSGKTSLGKLLAQKLDFALFDTDEVFVCQEKKSITEYVACHGWNLFREKEEQILLQMPAENAVISCGGGIILREKNRLFLKQNVFTVFLDVPVSELVRRLEKNAKKEQRPAFTAKSLAEEMQELYQARYALYEDSCQYKLVQYADMAQEVQLILEQYAQAQNRIYYN